MSSLKKCDECQQWFNLAYRASCDCILKVKETMSYRCPHGILNDYLCFECTSKEKKEMSEIRPNYYKATYLDTNGIEQTIECFQVIEALNLGFLEGNILKYLWRCGKKTKDTVEDLKKVVTYANQALKKAENDSKQR